MEIRNYEGKWYNFNLSVIILFKFYAQYHSRNGCNAKNVGFKL
jgi:hypothetical protein